MSGPIPVNILSDDDDDEDRATSTPQPHSDPVCIDLCTPFSQLPSKKKPRLSNSSHTNHDFPVFIIDEEVTTGPTAANTSLVKCSYTSLGASSTPYIVDETPMSELSKLGKRLHVASSFRPTMLDCSSPGDSLTPSIVGETPVSEFLNLEVPVTRRDHAVSSISPRKLDDLSPDGLIYLGSDSESDRGLEHQEPMEAESSHLHLTETLKFNSRFAESRVCLDEINQLSKPSLPNSAENHSSQVHSFSDAECEGSLNMDIVSELKCKQKDEIISNSGVDGSVAVERMSKEERLLKKEQEKLNKAIKRAEALEFKKQEKLKKAAEKAEAAELRKLQRERQKWEKGKFARKSIVAHIDNKVVEIGSVGGLLLTRFGEKGLSFHVASNPIERSIVWTMSTPEELSLNSSIQDVQYVLLIYGAEEFCNAIQTGTLVSQISEVQHQHPKYKICFLVSRLMAYIKRREQAYYKNPDKDEGWKRPPIEEVLANLTTHYVGVHSRLCADEAELAEHVVSLTFSLASCQYRKRLSQLSVNANGSLVPKDCPDKNLIKKDMWLKALIAIPKVQPRFAIAISKKYPTMRSLLNVYMDPNKSVHEKEYLLKDLPTEGLIGEDRRLGEICSKRIYRVIMAQCGTMLTDDVEDGADFFTHQTTTS